MIVALVNLIDLINSIPTDTADLMINFGNFDFGGTDARTTDGTQNLPPNVVGPAPASAGDQVAGTNGAGAGASAQKKSFFSKLTSTPGLTIGLLQPSNIFKLLMGQQITIFDYDMPTLSLSFSYEQLFPIFGPLVATLAGRIGVDINIGFGFDTSGLIEFKQSGDFLDVFDGFYVKDTRNGVDIPELTLSGSITAGAKLDFGVASAGVEGGIFVTVHFNLNDPNHDGKVRV